MLTHLLNRFSLHAAKWNPAIGGCLFIIWIAVLGCIISSILEQPFDRRQRVFWIAVVLFVPIMGVLAYIPFAFRMEDLPHILQRRNKRSSNSRKTHTQDIDA